VSLIKTRFGTWGIFVLSLWASVLALVNLARILLLSEGVQFFGGDRGATQSQIWMIFILNILFFLGFGSSAYGLSKQYNWGRIVFLWFVVIWSSFNLIALFAPNFYYLLFSPSTVLAIPGLLFSPNQDYTVGELTFNGLRHAVELILPLWYLNLPHIKIVFHTPSAENFTTEGTTDDSVN
jgi:hypothetical protein